MSNEIVRNPDGTIKSGVLNPKGRGDSKSFTTLIREAIQKVNEGEDMTSDEQAIIKKIIEKAKRGDNKMLELMWNYFDGKPQQKIEQSGKVDIVHSTLSEEEKARLRGLLNE